ncbi:protein DOG1-like 1 [Corylus avellana]|uniref:protein DOG1-like 1 n=1 Tax=Corylus avellana TaxID=13451 RepID=UPI00286D48E1|nr:protein DOG1-like 1 [Corylus avellana]
MASEDQVRSQCCFLEWMNLQEQELAELHQALNIHAATNSKENINLTQLAENCIKHFQDYADKRTQLARHDVSAFFAPAWCTNFENSLLWVAGCRPSQYIRLVYTLHGLEIEAQLIQFLEGIGDIKNLGELSSKQIHEINSLQGKTIRAEEKVTTRMAILQEDAADNPIVVIVMKELREVGEMNGKVERALDKHEQDMVGVLEEADRLRLTTLKELLAILTPRQAMGFLAASKQLHLCVHEWGKMRDFRHGRGNHNNLS